MAWYLSSSLYKSVENSQQQDIAKENMSSFAIPEVDNPPPYDRSKSTYQQFVDKLIDSTASRFRYQLPKNQTTSPVDRKSLSQGVKLVEIAVDEFETGNEAIGLDVYLAGLDKIIMALPNLKEIKTKHALGERLKSLEERVGITAQQQQQESNSQQQVKNTAADNEHPHNKNQSTIASKIYIILRLFAPPWLLAMVQGKENTAQLTTTTNTEEQHQYAPIQKFKLLNRAITDIIVHCVVLFRQSPVPGLMYSVLYYFMFLIIWFEGQFQAIEKVQHISIACIKLALKTNEKYHLHEFATEALYTLVSTFLKAIVAYKETPPVS